MEPDTLDDTDEDMKEEDFTMLDEDATRYSEPPNTPTMNPKIKSILSAILSNDAVRKAAALAYIINKQSNFGLIKGGIEAIVWNFLVSN